MFYVYVIQSQIDKSWYIGYTKDLDLRIKQHNRGESIHTRKHLPYNLICYFALPNKKDAKRYEKYLKSGYGRRTLKKMLKEYLSI
ncbi:GIY-YIG nuclease family protein [Candidatus Dojkabacteria bacterium]|uniref:GIY-YIG nuclease family protein n=1 Tax=Candidatus Dojkabacteria bacterium TaxID=2099670 RepID=A0A955L035_9BACT|nr:GIY-YIG nuclease family protein [Candidatus Dojkabacteria bacterium]